VWLEVPAMRSGANECHCLGAPASRRLCHTRPNSSVFQRGVGAGNWLC